MNFTLNKHVKWRVDRLNIFICDCKRMVDLKLPLKYKDFMNKISRGVKKEELESEERKVFSDFEKMNLLSKLNVRKIKKEEFNRAMNMLDNELKIRVRDNDFLYNKFEKFPDFFIGVFLDKQIIGIICGFPREDYLLMSEIAVDEKFRGRGFGRKLVETFEKIAKRKYKQIKVGAEDEVIDFYKKLNYKPSLLIQFKEWDYKKENFGEFNIRKYGEKNKENFIEAEVKDPKKETLERYRDRYPKAHFQYIFTKEI